MIEGNLQMLETLYFSVSILLAASLPALAECGKKPPSNNWNIQAGDQNVTGKYLAKLLPGSKVKFTDGGVEKYGADGSYSFQGGGRKYPSNGFKFYKNGIRCIDYTKEPRYDMYVVNDGKLVLINWVGGRYVARLTK